MILDMKVLMETPGAREDLSRITAAMEADPKASALLDAMHSIEDAYAFVKQYVNVKFEAFKELFTDAVNYFKEDKIALQDEVLDGVVGGFSWSSFWENKIVKYAAAAVTVCGLAVIGLKAGSVAGAVVGGPVGLWVGAAVGFVAGVAAGVVVSNEYIFN